MTTKAKLRFGLIINPYAGIGGKVGLKGSDGDAIRKEAFARGATQQAMNRTRMALQVLDSSQVEIEWFTVSGDMGESLLVELGHQYQVCYQAERPSTEQDTLEAIKTFNQLNLDLVVFAGGDGTARNVCQAVKDSQLVLGIPAGVKIHSGVYAITPHAAGIVMQQLLNNELVSVVEASVMDIDESAFRQGQVRAKKYGEMLVPAEHQYIQATKVSSSQLNKENEALVQADIAEYIVEQMDDEIHYLIGSGTSCAAVMEALDLPNSLLGFDWIFQENLQGSDLTEQDILQLIEQQPNKVKLILTVIGGQGHLIGRGNQQISAKVLAQLSKDDLIVIATKSKINSLAAKPLVIDSDKMAINHKFHGLIRVITGYEDEIFYQVGFDG
ncbi:MAG: ATP-NAD kinase family protein [Gammaproteobacteria bacterium]|nr:ATP-NAD kinase family protein [Gammaproteobacteria bacterium]